MENHITTSSKKPIVSLVCAVISIVFLLPIGSEILETLSFLRPILPLSLFQTSSFEAFFTIFIGPQVVTIIGLIFGILGLKSSKRKMAIWGIVICVVLLLIWIYTDLVFNAMWSYYNQ